MIQKTIKDSQCIFHGIRFNVRQTTVKTRDGRDVERQYVEHPGAVVILPIVDEQNIILIRNYRYVVGETLWELPAGTLEPGEPPIETAKRELIEETGYQCGKIRPLFEFYTTPGICNEVMYVFVAEELTFVGQDLDDTEEIEVEIVSWAKVKELLREGKVKDGKSMCALQKFVLEF